MRRLALLITLVLALAVVLGAWAARMSSAHASTQTSARSSSGHHDDLPGDATTSHSAALDEGDSGDDADGDSDVLATTLSFALGAAQGASLAPEAHAYAPPFAERAKRPPRA